MDWPICSLRSFALKITNIILSIDFPIAGPGFPGEEGRGGGLPNLNLVTEQIYRQYHQNRILELRF